MFIVLVSTNVLADCVSGLGLLVCFYYGFTGLACVIFYRRELLRSARNFLRYFAGPSFGFVVLMVILVKGAIYYGNPTNTSSTPLLGLGVPDWIALLGIVLGGTSLMLSRRYLPGYWRREHRQIWGDEIVTVTPEAEFAPIDSML